MNSIYIDDSFHASVNSDYCAGQDTILAKDAIALKTRTCCMSAPRMNIYAFPHKGLRNALGQWLFEAGKLDATSPQSIDQFKAITEDVVTLLTLHQHSEDQVVIPDLESRAPGSTDHNHAEHDRLHTLLEEIHGSANTLEAGQSHAQFSQLYTLISHFISDYFKHMWDEEAVLVETIWAHFSDQDIIGWHGRIMEAMAPEHKMLWFRFMVPALNPMERQIVMGGFKNSAPAQAYSAALKMLHAFMPAEELAALADV